MIKFDGILILCLVVIYWKMYLGVYPYIHIHKWDKWEYDWEIGPNKSSYQHRTCSKCGKSVERHI